VSKKVSLNVQRLRPLSIGLHATFAVIQRQYIRKIITGNVLDIERLGYQTLIIVKTKVGIVGQRYKWTPRHTGSSTGAKKE
jgi:hypothetical protein